MKSPEPVSFWVRLAATRSMKKTPPFPAYSHFSFSLFCSFTVAGTAVPSHLTVGTETWLTVGTVICFLALGVSFSLFPGRVKCWLALDTCCEGWQGLLLDLCFNFPSLLRNVSSSCRLSIPPTLFTTTIGKAENRDLGKRIGFFIKLQINVVKE